MHEECRVLQFHGEDTFILRYGALPTMAFFSNKSAWEAIKCRINEVDWGNLVWDSAIRPKHIVLYHT